MNLERYNDLMESDSEAKLTPDEIALGWHFCPDWDGLLIGPIETPDITTCAIGDLCICSCESPEIKLLKEKYKNEIEFYRRTYLVEDPKLDED